MIVILASRFDEAAFKLADRWSRDVATAVMTCTDLSLQGWNCLVNDPGSASVVVHGQVVPQKEIDGVLTRLPCIFESDLTGIVPTERSYVAAEMQAWLIYWLTSLHCPVINRPTPASLSGPNWRTEQWVQAAAGCGIPVCCTHRHIKRNTAPPDRVGGIQSVQLIGDRLMGSSSAVVQTWARDLAKAAGVELLELFLTQNEPLQFLGADVWPDLAQPEAADAVLELLLRTRS